MKAAALPEAVLLAVNELEAAATQREKDQSLTEPFRSIALGASNGRLQLARVRLASVVNAECSRQFEAGLEAARAENAKPR